MASTQNKEMEAKLHKLECPFTWDISKPDIKDLPNISEKLLDRVKFCPRRYHATYLNILAFVSQMEGNSDAALEYLHMAENILNEDKQAETTFVVTYSSFAWVHYHCKNLQHAMSYVLKVENICRVVSKDIGSLVETFGEKGWTYLRLGATFYEKAKVNFQKAVEGDMENVSYNVGYAVTLYRLEGLNKDGSVLPEASEAVKQLRRALQLDPSDAEVMVLLALKLPKSCKHESLRLIREALRLSPDVPQVTRYAAKYFRMEGFLDESLEILQRAIELAPNSSFLHHQIGLCYKQQIVRMFQTGKKGKGIVAQKKAKTSKCIHHLSKAVELKPSNIHARVNLAEAFGENWQLAKAHDIYTKLLQEESLGELDRQHCHACFGVFLLYKIKDEEQAIKHFKQAYQLPVRSWAGNLAGKKLQKIAEKWIHTQQCLREAFEILALVNGEEKQAKSEKQEKTAEKYQERAKDSLAKGGDLSSAFVQGMKLK